MQQIPRNITRSGYLGMQHSLRAADCREDAGLPAHPANGWIECPTCEGSGETDVHWFAEDAYTCNVCPRCSGQGDLLDGHEDPLVALRRARYMIRRLSSPTYRMTYRLARSRAMARSYLPDRQPRDVIDAGLLALERAQVMA